MASLPNFSSLCVWHEDWQEVGPSAIDRWTEEILPPEYDSDSSGGGMGSGRSSLAGSHDSLAGSAHSGGHSD